MVNGKQAGSSSEERFERCQKIFEQKRAASSSDPFDDFLDAILEARLSEDEAVDADRNFSATGRIKEAE